jgi:hypothetical protein
VKKKPRKVEESAAPYTGKKPAAGAGAVGEGKQIRYLDPVAARKLTKEILDKHDELFRKLAQ